jgi:hypothetical protein
MRSRITSPARRSVAERRGPSHRSRARRSLPPGPRRGSRRSQEPPAEVVPFAVEVLVVAGCDGLHAEGCGCLLVGCGVNGGALRCEVAFDGEGELREVGVADDLAELGLGLEHPCSGPAQAHVAGLPVLYVARGAADDLDHRLDRVRRGQRLLQAPADSQAGEGEGLLQSLGEGRGCAGMGVLQLAGEGLQALQRECVIIACPGARLRRVFIAGRSRSGGDPGRCVPCGEYSAAPGRGRRPHRRPL